ncbi:hypothetical protein HK101_011830 [Irineochytrium annulatum]|nr:hypothetical protein HK101_011830 [Irineochytrium annulatum]
MDDVKLLKSKKEELAGGEMSEEAMKKYRKLLDEERSLKLSKKTEKKKRKSKKKSKKRSSDESEADSDDSDSDKDKRSKKRKKKHKDRDLHSKRVKDDDEHRSDHERSVSVTREREGPSDSFKSDLNDYAGSNGKQSGQVAREAESCQKVSGQGEEVAREG